MVSCSSGMSILCFFCKQAARLVLGGKPIKMIDFKSYRQADPGNCDGFVEQIKSS